LTWLGIVVDWLLVLLFSWSRGAAAEETTDCVADGGTNCDTTGIGQYVFLKKEIPGEGKMKKGFAAAEARGIALRVVCTGALRSFSKLSSTLFSFFLFRKLHVNSLKMSSLLHPRRLRTSPPKFDVHKTN
jgi:hypothetical protein